MSTFKFFVGIDISKLTMDISVLTRAETCVYSCKVSNSFESLQELFTILRTSYKIKPRDCIICAEDMGVYATHLTSMATSKKLNLWLESPLRIKRTLGIQRQKNDAYDALQIAKYALRNVNDVRIWQPPRVCIQKLKSLTTIRKRLLKVGRMLTNSDKLDTYFLTPSEAFCLREYSQDSVSAVKQDVNRVNLTYIKPYQMIILSGGFLRL